MSAYIGNIPVPQATQTRQTITATASQTTFNTVGYTAGFVDVYMNGVKLVDGTDFTATNGSTVVLTTGAAASDTIEVVAYSTFEVNSQNFTGGLTVDNDGATVLTVDRATSDGTIIDVQKDGSSVGSISSSSGKIAITLDPRSAATTGSGFLGGDGAIFPSDKTGVASDADVSLGGASTRFKDLYLSNSVKVITATNGTSIIDLGDTADSDIGRIAYDNSVNAMYFKTNNSEAMRIGSSGNITFGSFNASGGSVGVLFDIGGSTSETEIQTSVNGTATRTHYKFINDNGAVGTITTNGSATAFNTSSDHRLKENVTDVTDGITRVKQLEPKRFNFIVDPDRTVDGFLAHEVQLVIPEAVTGTHNEVDDDGNAVMQGIDQSKLVPLLTAALKEAITKIETLETEMTSVKARLDALEGN